MESIQSTEKIYVVRVAGMPMDFESSEEVRQIQRMVDDFIEQEIEPGNEQSPRNDYES